MEGEKKLVRWSKTAVTNAGTAMLAEYAAGRILNITSAFGSIGGDDDLTELEELADGRAHPLTIESVTRNDSSVTACIQVTSLGNETPYKLERIGLFAITKDPGELEKPDDPDGGIIREDKMLVVVEDVEDEHGSKGVTVPAESDQLYTFRLYVVLTITNKDRLEISVSSAGIATLGAIEDHNKNLGAHPSLTARVRAAELALNGSETILSLEGGPTIETVGKKDQYYIDLSTGTEYVCDGITEDGYVWRLAGAAPSMREAMGEIEEISGEGAPTESTAGMIGQKYTDTSTGTVYTCIAAAMGENGATNYTWVAGSLGTLAEIRAALHDVSTSLSQKADAAPPQIFTVNPINDWAGTIQFSRNAFGEVNLLVQCSTSTTPGAVNAVIGTLPEGFRPVNYIGTVPALDISKGTLLGVSIDNANGNITAFPYSNTASAWTAIRALLTFQAQLD